MEVLESASKTKLLLPFIDKKQLMNISQLAEGHFGYIYKADWRMEPNIRIPVALKLAKTGSEGEIFQETKKLMKLQHPNIAKAYGLCTLIDGTECLVMEFATGGSLLNLLKILRCFQEPDHKEYVPHLLRLLAETAEAMKYVEQAGFVHRDIAARNVLLTASALEETHAKLADFGLCRNLYSSDYYKLGDSEIPIAWSAPEILLGLRQCTSVETVYAEDPNYGTRITHKRVDPHYTIKSDIWSFGVFIWEVLTLGEQPFHGYTKDGIIDHIVIEKKTLPILDSSEMIFPQMLRDLLIQLWNTEPLSRPGFSQVAEVLTNLPYTAETTTNKPMKVPDSDLISTTGYINAVQSLSFAESILPSLLQNLKKFYQTFSLQNIFPHDPSSALIPLDEIWINLETCYRQATPSTDYSACLEKASAWGYPVIVQGEPGSGKSTLVKKLCHSWADNSSFLSKYKIVLVALLRDVQKTEFLLNLCLQWLCSKGVLHINSLDTISKVIDHLPPEDVLIILDGMDENIPDCQELHKLFQNDTMPFKHPLIITTRPYKAFGFNIRAKHYLCTISNLTLDQQIEYAHKFQKAHNEQDSGLENFKLQLQTNHHLQQALSTPLLLQLSLLCGFCTEHVRQTDLYHALCSVLIATYAKTHQDTMINVGDWKNDTCVIALCKLSFQKLLNEKHNNKFRFSEAEIQDAGALDAVRIGFLLKNVSFDYIRYNETVNYTFHHRTVQEFFASIYLIAEEETNNQEECPLDIFLDLLEEDCLLRMECQQLILLCQQLTSQLCNLDTTKQHKLIDLLSVVVFPFLTENLAHLYSLSNECISEEQRELVQHRADSSFNTGWAEITFDSLLHNCFARSSLKKLASGVYAWSRKSLVCRPVCQASDSVCPCPKATTTIVFDGTEFQRLEEKEVCI